jgi:PD-(D/E)XK nuclease superfamily
MALPVLPSLSISHSALIEWNTCEFKWWLTRIASWQGWPGGINAHDVEALTAYRDKKLLTPDQLVGTVVHSCAAELVRAVRDGRRPPLQADLHERLRKEMAAVWRRRLDEFVKKPGLHMIHEHYYGLPHDAAVLARLKLKVGAAMQRLFDSELMADLSEAGRGEIVCVDNVDAVPLGVLPESEGMVGRVGEATPEPVIVPLFAAPDLALVSASRSVWIDGVRLEPPVPQLLDYKTSARLHEPTVRAQLATYAFYARERLGIAPHARTGAYVGRVIDLSPAGREDAYLVITPRDIDDAIERLRAGVADILSRARDERGVMLREAARRTPTPERTCAGCSMVEACALSRGSMSEAERDRYPTPESLRCIAAGQSTGFAGDAVNLIPCSRAYATIRSSSSSDTPAS